MKLIRGFKVHRFVLTIALCAAPGLVTHAIAQERSFFIDLNSTTVTPLGTLGGYYSYANRIPLVT